jgi:3D (Asp-Asp-Asp) domain-containing protein
MKCSTLREPSAYIENCRHRSTLRTRIMIWFLRHWSLLPLSEKTDLRWIDLLLAAAMIMVLLLAMLWADNGRFAEQYETVASQQVAMQSELTDIQDDLTALNERVEDWTGITETAEIEQDGPAIARSMDTEPDHEYVGEFRIYAYCEGPNDQLTATGAICEEGVTVAAAWSVFPAGTRIWIEGIGERTVQDKCSNPEALDVYMKDRNACLDWGVRTSKVWVIN